MPVHKYVLKVQTHFAYSLAELRLVNKARMR